MFSVAQKRDIAEKVQRILRETNHPELPAGEIQFTLNVVGAEPEWGWATIQNNGDVPTPEVNPWNEAQAIAPGLCNDEFTLKHGYFCELPRGHAGEHEATCPNAQFHQCWPQDSSAGKPLC